MITSGFSIRELQQIQSYSSDSRLWGAGERFFGSDLEKNVEMWHHLVFKREKPNVET